MEHFSEAEAQRIFAEAARRARINPARFDVALDRIATLVAHRTEPDAPDLEPLLDLPDGETTDDSTVSPTRRTRA